MATKPVSIFRGVDSGGICPCVTPPTTLSPAVGNVFVEKIPVMANTKVLTSVPGVTCTTPSSGCVSIRIVKAVNATFVNGVSISTVGDVLNPVTRITVPLGSASVFA